MPSIEFLKARKPVFILYWFSHPQRMVPDLLWTTSDTLADPLVLKISIIPRPSYRVFTNLLAIGPIFGQILSALIVWSNRWLEAETRRQVEWLCSYWVPLSPPLIRHTWSYSTTCCTAGVWNSWYWFLMELLRFFCPRDSSQLIVLYSARCLVLCQYYWLGENANSSTSYLDECIPIGVTFLWKNLNFAKR